MQPEPKPSAQAYDGRSIPQEDLDLAWLLARKYRPDILLFLMRHAIDQHSSTTAPPITWDGGPGIRHVTSALGTATLDGKTSQSSPQSGSQPYQVDSNVTCNEIIDTGSLDSAEGETSDADKPSLSRTASPNPTSRRAIRTMRNSTRELQRSPHRQSDNGVDQKKPYFCVFQEHKTVRFGKVSDLRKHMNAYHEPGKRAWLCPDRGCRQLLSRAESFKQHHRTHKDCRKPCKHADECKIKIPTRQAFGCGCQSCPALFFEWEQWREHVIQHIEAGMSDTQWHYATMFLNLLRRPEIAPRWEDHLSFARSFNNLVPRFNFRPRKTLSLKWHLEHMTSEELQRAAPGLASQAYEAGIEIRTLQELSDPFSLVEDPRSSPSSTVSHPVPWQALPEEFSIPPRTDDHGTLPDPAPTMSAGPPISGDFTHPAVPSGLGSPAGQFLYPGTDDSEWTLFGMANLGSNF